MQLKKPRTDVQTSEPTVADVAPVRLSFERNAPKTYSTRLINLSKISSTRRNQEADDFVLFDSGANCCCTFDRSDFVSEITPVSDDCVVEGIGSAEDVKGKGIVAWTFVAENGMYGAEQLERTRAVQDQRDGTRRVRFQLDTEPRDVTQSEGDRVASQQSEGARSDDVHDPIPVIDDPVNEPTVSHQPAPTPSVPQPSVATSSESQSPVPSLQRATQPEAPQSVPDRVEQTPTSSVNTEDWQPQIEIITI